MTPRYVVTEIEGWLSPARHRSTMRPGVSVQVIDRMTCHRVVRSWRTEDYGGSRWSKLAHVRKLADAHAARLNGEEAEDVPKRRQSHFAPVCPSCGVRCDPTATYCVCGKNLYRQEWRH